MKFSFCGKILQQKDKPLVEMGISKNGKNFVKIKFIVNTGTDSAFVEAFASEQEEIKCVDYNKDKFSVPWADRLNPEIVSRSTHTFMVNGFGDKKVFLSQYDQILYLKEVLGNYEGKVIVTGQMNKSYYNGKWYDNYTIQNVYAAKETDKTRLFLYGTILFNKDSADMSAYEKQRIITLNGYIPQYIDKNHPEALVPHVFILNASKIDQNNKAQMDELKIREACLQAKSRNKWYKMGWEILLKNGQEEVEWDESQLTEFQQLAYKTGAYSLDDLKPSKKIYGERITEFRLIRPTIRNEYLNGPIVAGSDEDIEPMIYHPNQVISAASDKDLDVLGQDLTDVDDLFG